MSCCLFYWKGGSAVERLLDILRSCFFLATVAQSQIVTAEQAALRGWQRLLAELMKVFSPPL